MWRLLIRALLRYRTSILLIAFIVGIGIGTIYGVAFGTHSFIDFISSNPSPRLILRFVFYIVLILGLTGIGRGIVDFFRLGDTYRDGDSFALAYEKIVRQTADYLTLFGGALLLLWLL